MPASRKLAIRTGLIFAGIWALTLVIAFIIHPGTDNLFTGLLVHAWFGVDALGNMSLGHVLIVALLQVLACFGLGYLIGVLFGRLRGV